MGLTKEKLIRSYQDNARAKCRVCGWEGTQGDCGFGHNGFCCPQCGKESIEIAEPKDSVNLVTL